MIALFAVTRRNGHGGCAVQRIGPSRAISAFQPGPMRFEMGQAMPFDREFSPAIGARRLARGHSGWRAIMPSADAGLVRGLFSLIAAASDAGAILLAAIGSGTIYHAMF